MRLDSRLRGNDGRGGNDGTGAASSDKDIARKRPDDEFIAQIKRVAKQLGWRT